MLQRPSNGTSRSASAFETVIDDLAETPMIYQTSYRGSRRVVMHRFPYLVWFVVADNTVTVLACVHGKINPATMQNRLS